MPEPTAPMTTPTASRMTVTITYGTASSGTAMKGRLSLILPTRKLFSDQHDHRGDEGPEEAHRDPLDHERPADEPVGRSHQLHDLDLPLAGEDRQPDGVGDEQDGHDAQQHDEDRAGSCAACEVKLKSLSAISLP